jgi:hypothetical protein
MMQGSARARETMAQNQLHEGAHIPHQEPMTSLAPATLAALPVYTPTPRTCSDVMIKDMTYDGEATWMSFLVKFTSLARRQQWTDDEQHDHFCLSLDVFASDYHTPLRETSPNLSLKDIYGKFEKRFGYSALGLYALDGQPKTVEEAVDQIKYLAYSPELSPKSRYHAQLKCDHGNRPPTGAPGGVEQPSLVHPQHFSDIFFFKLLFFFFRFFFQHSGHLSLSFFLLHAWEFLPPLGSISAV